MLIRAKFERSGAGSLGRVVLALSAAWLAAGCVDSGGRQEAVAAQSCMLCHNGSDHNDYAGPGLEDPHPFPGAQNLLCTTCHGGNGSGDGLVESHVPPPPQIGDDTFQETNFRAYFNRLTLTGVDKFPDYSVNGRAYKALDWLQFVNPGDLRVVEVGRGCGQCHVPHARSVARNPLATEAGIFAGAMYAIGVDSQVPESVDLYADTASDTGFRAQQDTSFAPDPDTVGMVARLFEFPVFSAFGQPGSIHNNPLYSAAGLADDREPDNSVIDGSPLADLFHEQVTFTCGNCHLGSAGANNRAGDFRSSGCTACHMGYGLGGRSGSGDPNVDPNEPLDPDQIEAPERAHVERHLIRSIAKTLPSGEQVDGISDLTCAGCHQGSNRTVMQFWGIRLDQNADLRDGAQYPVAPAAYFNTNGDTRLFDPVVGNDTFNGRNRQQYIRFEDYDGDGRDDTPADVHYDAGMGCIDCHGSYDLHGDLADPGGRIPSRMEQAVAIRCEDCHGAADAYAPTAPGVAYDGQTRDLAMDSAGNPLRHVYRDGTGSYWLRSRLTGDLHYIKQTLDTVVDSGKLHPVSAQPIYSAMASYAMGRDDGNPGTGTGPHQTGGAASGFSHTDRMDCASCHSSWSNSCIGCHLEGEYTTNPNTFSNVTGQRIVFRERNADFVYQTPVPFQLGVSAENEIAVISPNTEAFFKYRDQNGVFSQVFAFSNRNGGGNNTLATPYPSLSHNVMMPHSIRGKVSSTMEGPRYCVACHLTDQGMASFGPQYAAFRTAMNANDFGALDFDLLRQHIGQNPGNQLNSPLWVHMVAGLGSGLFLFDEDGCPVNPLDNDANRKGCNGVAPASVWDPLRVALNLDRIVLPDGTSTGSNNHPMFPHTGPSLRDGAADPELSGPLGATLIQRLTDPATGIVLDSWIDADGQPRGDASLHLDP